MLTEKNRGEINSVLLFVMMAVAVAFVGYVILKVLPWNAKKREIKIEETQPVPVAPPARKQGFGGHR